MPIIELSTFISAPPERVFDLARSIDAHQATAEGTNEKAVAGVTSGLIGLGQEVTWEARHFGIKQRLTVRITALDRPHHFQDVMLRGAFKSMRHDHHFQQQNGGTVMLDQFNFTSPLGPLGTMVDRLFLANYLRNFLRNRASALKRIAESTDWRQFIPQDTPRPI